MQLLHVEVNSLVMCIHIAGNRDTLNMKWFKTSLFWGGGCTLLYREDWISRVVTELV